MRQRATTGSGIALDLKALHFMTLAYTSFLFPYQDAANNMLCAFQLAIQDLKAVNVDMSVCTDNPIAEDMAKMMFAAKDKSDFMAGMDGASDPLDGLAEMKRLVLISDAYPGWVRMNADASGTCYISWAAKCSPFCWVVRPACFARSNR